MPPLTIGRLLNAPAGRLSHGKDVTSSSCMIETQWARRNTDRAMRTWATLKLIRRGRIAVRKMTYNTNRQGSAWPDDSRQPSIVHIGE